MTPEIRRLGTSDAEAYRAFFLTGLERDPDAFLITRDEAKAQPLDATVERLANSWVFGAFDGAELVAVIGGRRFAMARQAHRMAIGPLYVTPRVRGLGLGGELLAALTAAARDAGILQLELEVATDNVTAIGLYERAGFRRTGIVPRSARTEAGFGDDITMLRRLD